MKKYLLIFISLLLLASKLQASGCPYDWDWIGTNQCRKCDMYYPYTCQYRVEYCDHVYPGYIPPYSTGYTETDDWTGCISIIPTSCSYGYELTNTGTIYQTCSPKTCPIGQTLSGSYCTTCSSAHVSDSSGILTYTSNGTTCYPASCKSNYYISNKGTISAQCKYCGDGYVVNPSDETGCVRQYCTENGLTTTAPTLSYAQGITDVYQNTTCYVRNPTSCQTGYYKRQWTYSLNSSVSGYYCDPCPSGQTSDGLTCFTPTCSAGQKLNGIICEDCPANTYSAGGSSTVCTACDTGFTSNAKSASCSKIYCSGHSSSSTPDNATSAMDMLDGSCFKRIPTACKIGSEFKNPNTLSALCDLCPTNYTSDGVKCYPTKCEAGQKLVGVGINAKCEGCPKNYTSDGVTCYPTKCDADYDLIGVGVNAKCEKKKCDSDKVLTGGICKCKGLKKLHPTKSDSTKCYTEVVKYNSSNQSVVTSWDYIEKGDTLYKTPKGCKSGYILCHMVDGSWIDAKSYSQNENTRCDTSCNKTAVKSSIEETKIETPTTADKKAITGKSATNVKIPVKTTAKKAIVTPAKKKKPQPVKTTPVKKVIPVRK